MSRAALVTGGSGGIGMAIARALGREGYAITLSARRADKLEAAATALRDEGHDVTAVPADVAHDDQVVALLGAHRERHGRLDVLVSNAGMGVAGVVEGTATKKLDLQLDVNLRAVYLLAREAIPMLKVAGAEHGKALLLNMASYAGKRGQGGLAAYSATKFGVVGLSQALHQELREDGIQVTALCPGFVATPMSDWVEGEIPKDRMIQPEDLAEAVLMLLRLSTQCVVPEIQFVRRDDADL